MHHLHAALVALVKATANLELWGGYGEYFLLFSGIVSRK